jgi:hypothetical protein
MFRNSLRWPRNSLYLRRLALTSPTNGGRSVGIVRLRTTATEFGSYENINIIIISGVRLSLLVLRPLVAYCTKE